ncbi:MAG: hypothetical protein IAE94_02760 [Chthoniobacterales bacterium]|nr:hypothetical protein [Chthoniobacterales bacterium]
MKKLSLTLLMAVAVVGSAFAGTEAKSFKEKVVVEPTCKFRANELQVDAFAAGLWYNGGRPAWGGGLGVNYFFTQHIGIGVEQDVVGRNNERAEWATIGNLFLRYPICSLNLAPYAVVGGGGSYGSGRSGHGFGHVGGGLEYRVTDNIGLFSDARWVYSSQDPRSGLIGRAGLRFAF